MTYLGWYLEDGTGRIVVGQDTLVMVPVPAGDFVPVGLMDKVYHHAPSNALIASAGHAVAPALASMLNFESKLEFDELTQVVAEILEEIYATNLAQNPELAEKAMKNAAATLLFGYTPDGKPAVRFFKPHADASIEILNWDEHLLSKLQAIRGGRKSTTELLRETPASTLASHGGSLALEKALLARSRTQADQLAWAALCAHYADCHVPVTQGGWGRSIGGELVTYAISPSGEYEVKPLFVFPENELHGNPSGSRLDLGWLDGTLAADDLNLEDARAQELLNFMQRIAELSQTEREAAADA